MFLLPNVIMNFFKIPNRLCRTDYFIIHIFILLSLTFILMIISTIFDSYNNIFVILLLFLFSVVFIAKLTCSVARLHDFGISGWWIVPLLPFGPISEFLLMLLPGEKGSNRFGESTK